MADRTTETRNGRSEAATEAAPAAPAKPAATSAVGKWLPLIVTVGIMPVLAFATTKFLLVPQMKQALSPSAASAANATGTNSSSEPGTGAPAAKTNFKYPMKKILVNVAGTMGTRYLMTSIVLVGTDSDLKAKIEQNEDQLMDLATGTLCTKTISDLEKPGSRNVIRAELQTVFNNALGGPIVKEIYITELAIQ